jgi:hypothetical protein
VRAVDVIRWLVTAAFVVVALLGVRLWWRGRSPATGWLTVMFAGLSGALLVNRLLPEERAGLAAAVGIAASAVVVLFPYLLFRFVDSLEPVSRRARALVTAGMAVVVSVTVGVLAATGAGADPSAAYRALVLGVLGVWTALTGWVVWRLWSAGRSQPTVTRRRMRTMGAAAGLLNAALVVSGVGDTDLAASVGQAIALVSAVTFLLAFSPPRLVRSLWRQADERALWQAEGELVAADTADAVMSAVLPHVAGLLGSHGALFVDAKGEETVVGLDRADLDRVRPELAAASEKRGRAAIHGEVATIVLAHGRLGVPVGAYTPLFGRDELALLERIGALLDLALSRVEASLTTEVLAAFERGLIPRIRPPAGLRVDIRYRAGAARLRLGGDFADVIAFPDGNAGFVIGDVSGHGPTEAAFAVGVHAGWRTLAMLDPHNPAAWFAMLDETFFHDHPERLVTAIAGRIDVAERRIALSCAGHPPPLVVGGETRPVDTGNDPLLGVGSTGRRKEHTLTLEPEQGLLLYTDGLLEQPIPDRPHERWSEAALLSWLDDKPLEGVDLDALLWDFGRNAFDDDVAVVLLRFDRPAGG